jgi:hypothetical protein
MSSTGDVGIQSQIPRDLWKVAKLYAIEHDWTLSKVVRVAVMKFLGYEAGKVEAAKVPARFARGKHPGSRRWNGRPPVADRGGYVAPREIPVSPEALRLTTFRIDQDEPIGGAGR